MKTICIGNAAGFWGDNLDAPRLLCESASLDYLTLEYLAELTMSILAHQKSRDSDAGFVTDFPTVMESLLPSLAAQPNLRIVTNAGGIHPTACARRVAKILSQGKLTDIPIAVVAGDDLTADLDRYRAAGEEFVNIETGQPLGELRELVVSANAYLGAGGIVDALDQNARIVITGRVADASLTVGPCVHAFGWKWDDWNSLATATVAGHLIECGAQMTGGMYSDWTEQISLAEVGYPIAEISADGSLVVTKPAGSGGLVTVDSVSEQLVYEIGDPTRYLTPDVVADFSQVRLAEEATDRVRVTEAAGSAEPDRYKVSLCYRDGFMASGTLLVSGLGARKKAERAAEIVFARLRRAGCEPTRTNVECLGAGDSLPGIFSMEADPPEVVLRITAADPSRAVIERFSRELAPLVTSGPPGVSGYTGPRARPRPVLAYWPTTISREQVAATVTVRAVEDWLILNR